MKFVTEKIFKVFTGVCAVLLFSGVVYADASYQAVVKEGEVLLTINDAKVKSFKQGDSITLAADDLVCMRSGLGVVVISDSSNGFNKQISTPFECLAIPLLAESDERKEGWFSVAKNLVGKYDRNAVASTSLITLSDGEYLVVENTSWYRNARTLPFKLQIIGSDGALIKEVLSNNRDASLFVLPRKLIESDKGETYALKVINKSGTEILEPMQISLEQTVIPSLADINHQTGATKAKDFVNDKALQYQLLHQKEELALNIKAKGADHPDTAQSYSKVGLLSLQLGKHGEAIVNLKKALNIRKKMLGKNDIELAKNFYDLGMAYENMGVAIKADEYKKKATTIWESNYAKSRGTRVVENQKKKRSYQESNNTLVDVLYGTDRAMNSEYKVGESLEGFYLGGRGPIDYGIARVSIPKTHKPGKMERPGSIIFTEEDFRKHIALKEIVVMDDAKEFFDTFNSRLNGIEKNDILVFVHGYNVSFGDAVRRTAQLSYDLKFKGLPMTYSWPSQSQTEEYWTDEASVQYTVPHLVTFLKGVIDNNEKGKKANIHIIGHSMGTRALGYAVKELSFVYGGKKLFKNIIFAAPDIDKDVFELSIFPYVKKTAEKITLYANSDDKALITSAAIHGGERVGQAGDNIFIFKGLDTIDASGVDTDFFTISHSYFSETALMVSDIKELIYKSLPPVKRKSLIGKSDKKMAYWGFKFD